jgi:hypothetical protein
VCAVQVTELSALADFADNGTERLRLFHDPNKVSVDSSGLSSGLHVKLMPVAQRELVMRAVPACCSCMSCTCLL